MPIPASHITDASASPFSQRLRQSTRPQHDRIEQAPLMARLFAPDYTLDEYQTLLARLYGFYNALEPALFSELGALAVRLQHRRKTPLLAADLATLGVSETAISSLPRCFDLPRCNTLEQRLGIFYVLEGSTMGGQIIRRKLLARFGDRVAGAVNFYSCYGSDAGREWRALRQLLDQHFDGAADFTCQPAIESAQAAFSCLTRWLEQPLP